MAVNSAIEKLYNEISGRQTLPDFREINHELELSDLEETDFLLRAVVRRIAEKLDFYTTMLEEVLHPETSNLYSIHETRAFDEAEKKSMYELYGKMMDLNRKSIEVLLSGDEKSAAEFIHGFMEDWETIRRQLQEVISKMRSSWKAEADAKEDLGYLG